MFDFFHKRPYILYASIAAFFVLGIVGLVSLPKNLFPDANPPQIVIITKMPGTTAQVVVNTISKPIENEVSRLSHVTDVSSVNAAGFSIVKVDFSYKKSLDAAAVDVANSLAIVKQKLPAQAHPAIYKTGDFTLPVDVMALSPKNKNINLSEIRKIADSFIKPSLLNNPNIGNVEVFGGYQGSINIEVNPFKAKKYGVNFQTIANAIHALNHDTSIGFVKGKNSFYTITFYGEKDNIEKLKQLTILPNVRLQDIANVSWSYEKQRSGYIGNGKEAIALSIQRAPGGSVLDVSNAARSAMKKLELQYPNIHFEISDTQRNLIVQSNSNMLSALRDAIIYTLIVIMLFLGNFRAIIAAGISIPMVFFSVIAVIWLTGGELNIVIYTAIILSLGMLTDDAVVVLENIERHLNQGKETLQEAISAGTKEVMKPVFAGTFATIAILFPLMFIGGFPQKIFRPLIETLIISLLVSYFLSVTFIPLLSTWLYRNGTGKTKVENFIGLFYEKIVSKAMFPFIGILKFTNVQKLKIPRRMIFIGGGIFLLMMSGRHIVPLVGRDSMPPMDTGIIKAQVAFSANSTVQASEKKLQPFVQWIIKQPWYKKSSIAFGTEPGVLSLGSGNLPTEASMTIIAVNRFKRKLTVWQLDKIIRNKIASLDGVMRDDVFPFGATSVSSIKATVDERLESPYITGLSASSHDVAKALQKVRGLTSISTSWDKDFTEYELKIHENKALSYGVTPYQIAMQLPIKGEIVGLNAGLESMRAQPIRLYLKGKFSQNLQTLRLLPIKTKFGEVPLQELATVHKHLTYAKIERDNMMYSVDVNGYTAKRATTLVTADAEKALKNLNLSGLHIKQAGDIVMINDSFKRMAKAVGLGLGLLLLAMIVIYRSVVLGIIMILVLPYSLIGAFWSMLLFDKPMCLPAMLGILLLFGIVIKNAILFVDFFQMYHKSGDKPFESAVETLKVRFRPIMMTSFGTMAGMIPIALEQAIGLERLSPLADIAIGGLLSFVVLIYVPMFTYISTKK
jgi:multidrug efflux pump subunit AcrB